MGVVRVSNQSETQDFIEFPFQLYDGDNSLWVPSMISDMENTLDRDSHPFYEDPGSDAQPFIFKEDGKIKGRIMAIESEPYNEEHRTNTAFFYFFESIESQRVADALFDAVIDWARSRGLGTVIGPMGLLAGDGHGALVEGFDRRPGMGMPWNPPYYQELIESRGFEKHADTLSAQVPLNFEAHQDLIRKLYRSAKKVKNKRGIEVKSFESKEEVRDQLPFLVPELSRVFNESFKNLPFYHPMDEEKMRRIINRLLSVSSGGSVDLVKLAMKDDRIIGFLLAYPNIVSELRKAGGKLFPFGWLRISLGRRFTRWVDVNGIGILPEFQGKGATVVLYAQLLKTLQESRFEHLIINQILENNHKNLREMKIFEVTEFDRVHRIFKREV